MRPFRRDPVKDLTMHIRRALHLVCICGRRSDGLRNFHQKSQSSAWPYVLTAVVAQAVSGADGAADHAHGYWHAGLQFPEEAMQSGVCA